jgi:hypothetical protein
MSSAVPQPSTFFNLIKKKKRQQQQEYECNAYIRFKPSN